MSDIIGFALIGAAAGTISGLLGIGGAVIMIPALIYFFGFDQKMAQGTTLLLMIPPIGLLAAIEYYKVGHVDIKAAAVIAVCFFIGGFFGSKLAMKIHADVLRKIFAGFMMLISIRMFFK